MPSCLVILANRTIRFFNLNTCKVTTVASQSNHLSTYFTSAYLQNAPQCPPGIIRAVSIAHGDVRSLEVAAVGKPVNLDLTYVAYIHYDLDIVFCKRGNEALLECQLNGSYATRNFPNNLCDAILPLYCPHTDSLIAVNDCEVHIFRNFLKKNDEGSTTAFEVQRSDLLFGSKALKRDLKFTHKASKTTFKLHSSIINLTMWKSDLTKSPSDRLATFIRSSTLPIDNITRFIEYLYFKPLPSDSKLLIDLAWISKAVFGDDDAFILRALQDRMSTLPCSEVRDLLISTWLKREFEDSSLIIAILIAGVQISPSDFKVAFDHFIISSNPSDLVTILPRMSVLLLEVIGPPLVPLLPAITNLSCSEFHPALLTSTASDFLNIYPTNFVIRLASSISIGVCGWLLYAHWPWFKSLVASGLQESKSRIITLSEDSLTERTLIAVICALQLILVLKHATAFGLISLDGNVLPRAKPFIDVCESRIFPPLTAYNCWEQLRLAHSIRSSKYTAILQYLPRLATKIDFNQLALLPEEVASDLTRELKPK